MLDKFLSFTLFYDSKRGIYNFGLTPTLRPPPPASDHCCNLKFSSLDPIVIV